MYVFLLKNNYNKPKIFNNDMTFSTQIKCIFYDR